MVGSTTVEPYIGPKGVEITSNLWEIEFGRSRTRITSVGDTSEQRTIVLISEPDVVIYLRQKTCGGVDIYG